MTIVELGMLIAELSDRDDCTSPIEVDGEGMTIYLGRRKTVLYWGFLDDQPLEEIRRVILRGSAAGA